MEYKICLLSKIFGTAKVARSQKIDKVVDLDELEAQLKTPTGKREIERYINNAEGLGICYFANDRWQVVQPDQVDYRTSIKMKLINDLLLQHGLMKNFSQSLIRHGFKRSGREALMKNMGL